MKRILAFLMVIGIFLLAICPAFADGGMELTILSENYIEYKGYSDMKGVYLAKVQNNTDQGYYLTTGTLILKDADGNEVSSNKYFSKLGSKYLAPGEITFLSIEAKIPEGVEVKDYSVEIIPVEKNYTGEDYVIEVNDCVYDGTNEDNPQITTTITNTYDKPIAHITLVFAVEDANGTIYYIGSESLGMNRLGANSSFIFLNSMSKDILTYVKEKGITLTQVEALAFAEDR